MAEYGTYPIYPLTGIDCQSLLSQPDKHQVSGWLRKRSFRNRLKLFQWPQVYVVLSRGCIYYFGSETSKKAHSFPLFGYNSILRDSEMQDALWVFKIIHTHAEYKTYYFSASSEKEMKDWMRKIKCEMDRANNKPEKRKKRGTGDGIDFDEESLTYQDIEEKLYDDPATLILPNSYKSKRNSELDSDDDMDGRPPIAPPIPPRPSDDGSTKGQKTRRKKSGAAYTKTEIKTKPDVRQDADTIRERRTRGDGASAVVDTPTEEESMTQEEYWSSIYYDPSKDTQSNETDIIRNIAEDGVFLVKRCIDGTFTLCFYAQNLPRKMKIQTNDTGRYFLQEQSCIVDSIEELVYHYYENNIPIKQFHSKLETPYKLHPKYKRV
ncbi:hypothetical protein LOTGIDRAFT_233522 [Lottia gigantea]|uniref:PH domain-containing protein n=1 Tax=Lottia gigantea TaxID=225164 RepID=V4ACJ4_LOTGI|nr:hypothetical protein LOTGIDRAFT_233522 [Lottia gigantea]ESO91031.1 hypothetical protein LOTGIDRAFT_233522 [Lottia gigantea]